MYLPSFLLFLHLAAVIVWVGGMATMHFAVRPAAASLLEPPQRLAFMSSALARFFTLVGIAVLVVLASGLWLMQIMLSSGLRLPLSIHIMAGIDLLMMAVFGHIRFALFPRLQRNVSAADWPSAAKQLGSIRQLVVLNLILGTVTVAIAVMGRSLF